jgi:hypothetical protein
VWVLAISAAAIAGYGDVSPGDYPSWEEREVHMWTNMVRVDPEEFFGEGNDWGADCGLAGFSADERTPKAPLYYDYTLNDAGRFHSQDMWANEHFSHSSSDGTSFPERMGRFYFDSGYIGENIAMGYTSSMSAVVHGWMCSDGHRANIMNADFNELGTGVVAAYYTQDFAAGMVETTSRIAMGNHSPENPGDMVDFTVDHQGRELDSMAVVLDGESTEMFLTYGTERNGVFTVTINIDAGRECHEYYFLSSLDGETETFPEDGSYLFGADCDEPVMWVEDQLGAGGSGSVEWGEDDDKIAACAHTATPSSSSARLGMFGLLCGLIWVRRRTHTRPTHRLQ